MNDYKTPANVLKLRNLLSRVPGLEKKLVKAEIRSTALPGYVRGGENEYPGKDYAFPASLESSLSPLQKDVDSFLDTVFEKAKTIATANLANANGKIKEAYGLDCDVLPSPCYRERERFDLMSMVKSAIMDSAVRNWYEANGLAPDTVVSPDGNEIDLDI